MVSMKTAKPVVAISGLGSRARILSNSAWINEISNPTHELMGTMDAMGAAVASTTKASFSRDTMHASVRGRIEAPATSVFA